MAQSSLSPAVRIRLLALPPENLARLLPKLHPVSLPLRKALLVPQEHIEAVYFIENGWASVVAQLDDGTQAEVGQIGAETYMQSGGSGMQMDASAFQHELEEIRSCDGDCSATTRRCTNPSTCRLDGRRTESRTMPDRIFVIEDDDATRYAYERALARAGYRTQGYTSYFQAAKEIDKGAGALLVVDIRLPPRTPNGLAIARMARQHRPGLPIIFVTGHPELAGKIDPEMGPVMLKPVDLDLLVSMTEERLKPP